VSLFRWKWALRMSLKPGEWNVLPLTIRPTYPRQPTGTVNSRWPKSAMEDHIRPGTIRAKITKRFGGICFVIHSVLC
jgi:hypothetical protein